MLRMLFLQVWQYNCNYFLQFKLELTNYKWRRVLTNICPALSFCKYCVYYVPSLVQVPFY